MRPAAEDISVLAPNLKRRLSGVTATIVRLVPLQNRRYGVWATGPGLPPEVPQIPLWRAAILPGGPRVWHARRNTEMALGLILRHVVRRDLRLMFTSAAQRRHTRFTRFLISRMDAVVATSRQAASYLDRPAEVVMHGVDAAAFSPTTDRAQLRKDLGLQPGVWVGCFGRIRHNKGTDVLVEALLRLMSDRPDLRCLLVGRPDDRTYMATLIDRIEVAGLKQRFRIVEHLSWSELTRSYAAMDVYAAPQRWEGFGLTPLEAMASGVPVVATRVGAFPDLVTEETGRLVPPGDVDAFEKALALLIDDPDARVMMSEAARAHVLANHSIEKEADALVRIYKLLLENGDA